MSERDLHIKKIRPEIDFGEIPQPLAQFQEVLRQVLKFQNDLLLQSSLHFLETKYKGFIKRDSSIKNELFYQSIKKDIGFKKDLIGMVKAMFTKAEMEFYLENQQEINKRLVEFLFKRISEQIPQA